MKTLVIDRASMNIGGIETSQVQLMRYCIGRGYRVVWLTTEAHEKASSYKEVTDLPDVEKYYVKRTPFGPVYPSVPFKKDEHVVALTTDLLRYCISQPTMRKWKCNSLTHLLTIPHFKGGMALPEMIFRRGKMREYWRRRLASAVAWLVRAGALVGFNRVHLTTYEQNYGISIPNKEAKELKSIFQLESPSEQVIDARVASRKKSFEIITCSRFDFPHKGYMLGLIDAFGGICERHPETRLIIVGYGEGEQQVKDALSRLPEAAQSRVELTGSLSPEQLKGRMQSCHLNVGVAGALWRGAECALPSISMRHYTLQCEGYGFLDEVGDILSEGQGTDMVPLIEHVIEMDDKTYIAKSLASFKAAQARKDVDPEYVFKRPETRRDTLPMPEARARMVFFQRLILEKVCKRSLFEDQIDA